ncbi:hypothetical protein SAMN05660330_01287 [Desulforhopalus singaporensis]|uniref:Uncharacterized protein n=1 Tax=Desulforhopalus singaporensis TaxID=91360 RepID=A0A1H0N7W4_9BACT|nr:hypothetical protein SAMN05660330_01287 [Desulforhopalus singaporensis]
MIAKLSSGAACFPLAIQGRRWSMFLFFSGNYLFVLVILLIYQQRQGRSCCAVEAAVMLRRTFLALMTLSLPVGVSAWPASRRPLAVS